MQKLIRATAVGTAAQIAMVAAGDQVPAITGFYAAGGMGISAVAGWMATSGRRNIAVLVAAGLGLVAGSLCAVIGIAVSVALGDVPPSLLLLGTAASAVTGAIGGLIGRWVG